MVSGQVAALRKNIYSTFSKIRLTSHHICP